MVVGGASPIGEICSQVLAEAGAFVAVSDWAPEASEKVSEKLLAGGGKAKAYPADSSKKLSYQGSLENLIREKDKIDLLINASSIAAKGLLLEMDEWDWRRALDLNLTSAFVTMQSVGRVMRDLGDGIIVNVIDSGIVEAGSSFVLNSAMAGLRALSENVEEELKGHNIQVSCLAVPAELEAVRGELLPMCVKTKLKKA